MSVQIRASKQQETFSSKKEKCGAGFPDRRELDTTMLSLCRSGLDASDQDNSLLAAVSHHFSSGGGRVRAGLAYASARAYHLSHGEGLHLAACCELLHNASLIHDDIQDKDTMRRGKSSLWAKYGRNRAICAGDLLLSAAYAALAELQNLNPALIREVHQATARIIAGQDADLDYRPGDIQDFSQYENIVEGKAAALLILALELPMIQAGASENNRQTARQAARHFGIGYQMLDDLADFNEDDHAESQRFNAVSILMDLQGLDRTTAGEKITDKALAHLATTETLTAEFPETIRNPFMALVRNYKSGL